MNRVVMEAHVSAEFIKKFWLFGFLVYRGARHKSPFHEEGFTGAPEIETRQNCPKMPSISPYQGENAS